MLYNAWFRKGNVLVNDVRHPSHLMHPLLNRLFEERHGVAGIGTWMELRGAPDVRLLTALSASVVEGSSVRRDRAPEEQRRLHLALLGDDQAAIADGLLRALDALLNTEDLGYEGYELGSVPTDHGDAAGALWATFLRHEGRYLMTCRQCGRTVLSTTQGGERLFCSDTCRATHNKALREASE